MIASRTMGPKPAVKELAADVLPTVVQGFWKGEQALIEATKLAWITRRQQSPLPTTRR